ncbi:hypothetical protein BLNAU_16187 [Blattamonas nauphoetae]|uniref:Uncharacterized protein n=1 Tax=Blattamonas nauphoetae TaxID=2049346 RepID=A0ABQ9XAX6_9EUKA|nr:hypothetical protein BLNAU_16187 [Blattamonas nauphoetae]
MSKLSTHASNAKRDRNVCQYVLERAIDTDSSDCPIHTPTVSASRSDTRAILRSAESDAPQHRSERVHASTSTPRWTSTWTGWITLFSFFVYTQHARVERDADFLPTLLSPPPTLKREDPNQEIKEQEPKSILETTNLNVFAKEFVYTKHRLKKERKLDPKDSKTDDKKKTTATPPQTPQNPIKVTTTSPHQSNNSPSMPIHPSSIPHSSHTHQPTSHHPPWPTSQSYKYEPHHHSRHPSSGYHNSSNFGVPFASTSHPFAPFRPTDPKRSQNSLYGAIHTSPSPNPHKTQPYPPIGRWYDPSTATKPTPTEKANRYYDPAQPLPQSFPAQTLTLSDIPAFHPSHKDPNQSPTSKPEKNVPQSSFVTRIQDIPVFMPDKSRQKQEKSPEEQKETANLALSNSLIESSPPAQNERFHNKRREEDEILSKDSDSSSDYESRSRDHYDHRRRYEERREEERRRENERRDHRSSSHGIEEEEKMRLIREIKREWEREERERKRRKELERREREYLRRDDRREEERRRHREEERRREASGEHQPHQIETAQPLTRNQPFHHSLFDLTQDSDDSNSANQKRNEIEYAGAPQTHPNFLREPSPPTIEISNPKFDLPLQLGQVLHVPMRPLFATTQPQPIPELPKRTIEFIPQAEPEMEKVGTELPQVPVQQPPVQTANPHIYTPSPQPPQTHLAPLISQPTQNSPPGQLVTSPTQQPSAQLQSSVHGFIQIIHSPISTPPPHALHSFLPSFSEPTATLDDPAEAYVLWELFTSFEENEKDGQNNENTEAAAPIDFSQPVPITHLPELQRRRRNLLRFFHKRQYDRLTSLDRVVKRVGIEVVRVEKDVGDERTFVEEEPPHSSSPMFRERAEEERRKEEAKKLAALEAPKQAPPPKEKPKPETPSKPTAKKPTPIQKTTVPVPPSSSVTAQLNTSPPLTVPGASSAPLLSSEAGEMEGKPAVRIKIQAAPEFVRSALPLLIPRKKRKGKKKEEDAKETVERTEKEEEERLEEAGVEDKADNRHGLKECLEWRSDEFVVLFSDLLS